LKKKKKNFAREKKKFPIGPYHQKIKRRSKGLSRDISKKALKSLIDPLKKGRKKNGVAKSANSDLERSSKRH
jgi:hypothetical protein